MPQRVADLVAVIVLIVIALSMPHPDLGRPVDFDEADYVRAAFAGVRANAFDVDDTNALRHFHPPGLQYAMMASMALGGRNVEAMRFPTYLLALLLPALLYLLLRWTFAVTSLNAFIASALLAVCPIHGAVAGEARHFLLVGATSMAVAAAAAHALTTPRRRALAIFALAWILAALSMEYAIPLLLIFLGASVICPNPWVQWSRRQVSVANSWLIAVGGALVGSVLLWPAGAVHGPANFIYYAIFYRQRGHLVDWLGTQTTHPPGWATASWVFSETPATMLCFFAALAAAAWWGWRQRHHAIGVFSLFTLGLFALGAMQHQLNVRYAHYWIPTLALQVGLLLHVTSQHRRGRWLRFVVLALLPWIAFDRLGPNHELERTRAIVAAVQAVLVDEAPLPGPVLGVGVPQAQAEFYASGGFDTRDEGTILVPHDALRGTAGEVLWRVGDRDVPVQIDGSIRKLVELSGQKGKNLLKVPVDQQAQLLEAELAAGFYTHALVRSPLPEDEKDDATDANEGTHELVRRLARTWVVVGTAPIVIDDEAAGELTLYRRP